MIRDWAPILTQSGSNMLLAGIFSLPRCTYCYSGPVWLNKISCVKYRTLYKYSFIIIESNMIIINSPISFLSQNKWTNLHWGEVSHTVKFKGHLHISSRETGIGPAHIIISWPHTINLALSEVIQAPSPISQLTKTLSQTRAKKRGNSSLVTVTSAFIV